MNNKKNDNLIGEIPAFKQFQNEHFDQNPDALKKIKRKKILRFSMMILLGITLLANVIIFYYLS